MQVTRAQGVAGAAVLIIVFGLAWWYFAEPLVAAQESCEETVAVLDPSILPPVGLPERTPPPGFERYRNEELRFSLFYPSVFEVEEFPEASDGFTVVFHGPTETESFQVFVVPYDKDFITETRFQKDVRTGFRRDEAPTAVDGICAVEFLSRSLLLGKTREVWVIHNGFLYELTTFRESEELLRTIVDSWRFL